MKRELIEKIYTQIFECKRNIHELKNTKYDTNFPCHIDYGEGRIKENIIFCEELLDIILKENE